MGLFKFIGKRHSIIVSQNTKEVDGAEVWVVSWNARYGLYHTEWKRVAKAFLTEEDADTFIESLKNAMSVLQYTENIDIAKEKQK